MFQPRQQYIVALFRSSKSRTNSTWGSMKVVKQEATVYCFILNAKLGVRTKPHKLQAFGVWLAIDEHQVRLDVAIPMVFPVTG